MPSPQSSILDNFNRADSAVTLGSNWTLATDFGAGGTDDGISSQKAYNPTAFEYKVMYWNAASYGADSEVYFKISTQPTANAGDWPAIAIRLRQEGVGTTDGYFLSIDFPVAASVALEIQRFDNDASTTLGSAVNISYSDGDIFWITAIGSTLTAYTNNGGSFTQILQRTDATYGSGGHLGLYLPGNVTDTRVDDFGGGGYHTASQRNNLASMLGLDFPWMRVYPQTDGTIAQADRQQTATKYSGILAGSPVAGRRNLPLLGVG